MYFLTNLEASLSVLYKPREEARDVGQNERTTGTDEELNP
jgi:hypothetical protein